MRIVAGLLFPLLAAAAPYGLFEQVDLFRQGDAGVHTYRIPALVETRRGTLVAVVDALHDSTRDLPGRISLVMRRSFDRGRTWQPARTIRAVETGGVGDPSLLLDPASGRLWCFYAYGPPGVGWPTAKPGPADGPDTLQVHAIWSDDDGVTWSSPVDLTPQVKDPAWHAVFATSGTHFVTAAGRMLIPMVVRTAPGEVCARNAYSDDRGRTWRTGPCIGRGTDESKAVEWKPGEVLQNMRAGKLRAVARSADGGVTFGPVAFDDALIDPVCNAGLARYRRGRENLLVFTNAAATKRENLTVRLSPDGGRTWPSARLIHRGPAAYSTVIGLRDGSLAVLYERGETHQVEKITFARFDLRWVRSAPLTNGE